MRFGAGGLREPNGIIGAAVPMTEMAMGGISGSAFFSAVVLLLFPERLVPSDDFFLSFLPKNTEVKLGDRTAGDGSTIVCNEGGG